MQLVFAGTPEFAASALSALLDAGHEVKLVLTQPDRPAGRGLKLQPSAIKQLAQARGLVTQQPVKLDHAAVDAIAAARPEAIVVAAYGLILPPGLLALPARGCLNVHASLLPRWRGAAPIERALLAGDLETGITIMQMDAGLDTGPVLLQEALPIDPADTGGTLRAKLAALGARLIVNALASPTTPKPQDEGRATYARRIRKEEAEIDWGRPADEIERHVRAFDPAPGAQTHLDGYVLKIWRARVERGVAGNAGTVCAAEPNGILVACGRDALRVIELQRAGGRRLSASQFLAGYKVPDSARLGAGNG